MEKGERGRRGEARRGEARRGEARRPGPEASSEGSTMSTLARQQGENGQVKNMDDKEVEKKTSIMFQQLNRDLRAQGCNMCFKHSF